MRGLRQVYHRIILQVLEMGFILFQSMLRKIVDAAPGNMVDVSVC